jgi:hypothetical protein
MTITGDRQPDSVPDREIKSATRKNSVKDSAGSSPAPASPADEPFGSSLPKTLADEHGSGGIGKKQTPKRVIYLKERNMEMLKKDLMIRNPLRLMGQESNDILPAGGFGAVMARAGVGKTALLVQLALDSLLNNKKVLHISLEDPVNKVSLWYEEVFSHIAHQYDKSRMNELWETILPQRFIMTFRVEGFSVPKLEERLTDLIEQKIFDPSMIIIDGLPFDSQVRPSLLELKETARRNNWHIWFTIRTHRHQAPDENGLPIQLSHVAELFEVALQLQPEGKEIHIRALKGGDAAAEHKNLQLDPATLLIKNHSES